MLRKLLLILSSLAILGASLSGATGTLSPQPYLTVLDTTGVSVPGACVWTYTAGTTTQVATYTDVALSAANTNPIIADSAGRLVAYLSPGASFKFVFEQACTPPAHGTVIKTSDNIAAVPTSSNSIDVVGTAGETLTAGQAVYLSDGSGGKTAGLWYKADSANAYSSTGNLVGMAPASIASAGTGSLRLKGSVSGLSSLTVGAAYYVGTAGAITSTAPTARRFLGQADTTTTLVLDSAPRSPDLPFVVVDDFRLSLTTGTCVTTADVTAATTLYATPCTGNRITLADTNGSLGVFASTEMSIAVPASTSQMYDVWVYSNAGTPTLELLAWTNDTTRATAIARTTTGFYTKSGDLTRRYVGSVRTTTVSGQTEDSVTSRFVWNYFNQKDRALQRLETTTSWTYASTTIRQANAAVANQVNFVIGVSEDAVEASVGVTSTFATGSQDPIVGLGLDSTTTFASNQMLSTVFGVAGIGSMQQARYVGYPGIGKHSLMWNESVTTTTTTFYSNTATVGGSATGGNFQSGIVGRMKG